MRWVWIGVCGLLVGCSRPNPWFELDSADATGAVSQSSVEEGPAQTDAGESDPPGASTTSGDTSTSVADSTGGVGSTTSTDTSGPPQTSGSETEVGETTGPDQTTGDPPLEGELYYDLWELCATASHWEASGVGTLLCNTDKPLPKPPWAGRWPDGFELDDFEPHVLAEVPALGVGNAINGSYTELTLKGKKAPYLRTVLVCPDIQGCKITARLWITIDNAVYATTEELQLSAGEHEVIDLDLDIPEITVEGQKFTVELEVKSQSGDSLNRGLWLRPRIVEFYP